MLLNCVAGKDFLRVPWTARRSNRSILKEVSPEYSLEWLNAEVEAPIPWPADMKSQLIGKDPDAGKDGGRRRRGWQRMRRLDGITDSRDMSLSKRREMIDEGQGSLACCSPWCRKESAMTEQLNWTEWLIVQHFTVQQKLTQHCKVPQYEKLSNKLFLQKSIW